MVPLLPSVLHSLIPLTLQGYCIFYGSGHTDVNKIDTVPTFIFFSENSNAQHEKLGLFT